MPKRQIQNVRKQNIIETGLTNTYLYDNHFKDSRNLSYRTLKLYIVHSHHLPWSQGIREEEKVTLTLGLREKQGELEERHEKI